MKNISIELKTAIEAAKIGAKTALKYYGKNIEYKLKDDKSQVTKADLETETAIKNYISSIFKNAKFVGEEFGGSLKEDMFWIIDPIDGTRSFRRGIPTWSVLIALCKNNEIILGVSYYPNLDELLYAELEKGAYCNGEKIQVSNVPNLIEFNIGYGNIKYYKDKNVVLRLSEKTGCARGFDSHYTTSLLAQGKMDGSIDSYAFPWDGASYKIIVEEAGGKFTNLEGGKWDFSKRGYIASNGLLHEQIIDIVNNKNQ